MFKVEEVNCICVDWKKGSQTTYTQAANNVRVVGAQVAQLLGMLSVSPPPPREAAPAGLCGLKMQLGVRYLKKNWNWYLSQHFTSKTEICLNNDTAAEEKSVIANTWGGGYYYHLPSADVKTKAKEGQRVSPTKHSTGEYQSCPAPRPPQHRADPVWGKHGIAREIHMQPKGGGHLPC